MNSSISRGRRPLGILTVIGLVVFGLALSQPLAASADTLLPGPAPVEQRSASTVTADPLPTVQIDVGVVWVQKIIGSTVYAGGSFSNARPAGAAAGTQLMPRSNILAYNIDTGVATSFAPVINGQVKSLAASPDGSRLYVGGQFTSVDGQTRYNFAAFDTATGALLSTFKPAVGGSYVNAIVATNTAVYVGGLIGAGNGVTRKNFAAFTASTGALLAWAPTSDLQVDAMVLAPNGDKIIAGGRFGQINGASQRGLAALDLTNGSMLPWLAPQTVINGMSTGTYKGKAGIFSLTTDATSVYGTGWVYADAATGNLEGTFSATSDSGAINWIADCHGDHYGVYSDGTNVYTTSHQHACESMGGAPQAYPVPGNLRHAAAYTAVAKGTLSRSPEVSSIYADWSGYPAPAAIDWYPDWVTGSFTGDGQAGWDVTGNGKYIVVGGEFPYVNGTLQQGIVRFSNQPAGGAKSAPRLSGVNWVPTAKSNTAGTVRISIPSNWDRDDLTLTYKLYRNGTAAPLQTITGQSTFWNKPTLSFSDSSAIAGSSQTYRLTASDPNGNTVNSNSVTITVSNQAASPYANAVLNDGASLYWRLGTQSGTTETDWAGSNDGTISNVTPSTGGAISGDPSVASTFAGTQSSQIYSNQQIPVPASYSMEFWLNTTTTSGGKILGYGDQQTGNSGSYDRHVYMTDDGHLIYGNYDGNTRTLTTANSYNDGLWHHVVATQGTGGMSLYVDGSLVGSDSSAPNAQSYLGYWRVGGDNLGGWPNSPSSSSFAGQIDEVAVYGSVLTASQAAAHYALGIGQTAPTAAFTSSVVDQTASFDGSTSSTGNSQPMVSYSWNYGDGSALGSGITTSHSYSTPGSYSVTLTVKSSTGLTGTVTNTVVAKAPHQQPTAVIASTSVAPNGMTGLFDGTGSTASDGATIVGYAWTFGDGATSTLAKPSHAYASPNTWPVTLAVTDSLGLTSNVVSGSFVSIHTAPTASFTPTTNLLSVAVDGSQSRSTDGQALSYQWGWGDGTANGSGVTAGHSYASAGNYTITLTVSDSIGAAASSTGSVTVAPVTYLASDDFGRTLASGWGSATIGGAWSGSTGLSVANGTGILTGAAGSTRTTTLGGTSVKDVDSTVVFSNSILGNGGGTHFNYLLRKSTAGDYRLKVRISAAGVVTVNIGKYVGTTETLFAGANLSGFTYTAGTQLALRFDLTTVGSSTQLQGRVWPASSAEPTAWTTTATDSQAELQAPGQVGISTYVTGSVTNGPVATSVSALRVK